MELNPNSAMEQSSLPLDLPLPNLPIVKEESGITDPSNSLIKEEKAVSFIFLPDDGVLNSSKKIVLDFIF